MIIIGIDPGAKGGIVSLNGVGHIETIANADNGLEWLIQMGRAAVHDMHVFIEKAQVIGGAKMGGSRSSFTYGVGFGVILGVLRALRIPHTQVTPATWTKEMHAGCKAGTTKERSLQAANRLFPAETWIPKGKKKPQDGLYESALIGEFGRRKLLRSPST